MTESSVTVNPFADIDIANAETDPFAAPVGTHAYTFTKFSTQKSKKEGQEHELNGLFKFNLDGSKLQNYTQWVTFPQTIIGDDDDTNARRAREEGKLKVVLKGLGVPDDELNRMSPQKLEDLYGTEVYITLVESNGYKNVRKIIPASEVADGVKGVAPRDENGDVDLTALAEFA